MSQISITEATMKEMQIQSKKDTLKSSKEPKIKKQAQNQKKNKGHHWNVNDQQKYINFLFEQKNLFSLDPNKRRVIGVHIKMSKIIRVKTAKQCRSHHQKMLMKYKNIDNIIQSNLQLLTQKNRQKMEALREKVVSEINLESKEQTKEDKLIFESFYLNKEKWVLVEQEIKEFQSQPFIMTSICDAF